MKSIRFIDYEFAQYSTYTGRRHDTVLLLDHTLERKGR